MYWSLILFYPSMIVMADLEAEPSSSDSSPIVFRLPLAADLALHACPVLSLTVNFFVFEQQYSKREIFHTGSYVVALAGVWYSCWVEWCASRNGYCASRLTSKLAHAYLSISPISLPEQHAANQVIDLRVIVVRGIWCILWCQFSPSTQCLHRST